MLMIDAPGKIMLAGEWSVLEVGNSCIVSIVERSVTANIKQSEKIIFNAPDVGLEGVVCSWDGRKLLINTKNLTDSDAGFKFCYNAAQVALQFLQAKRDYLLNFEITIKSNLSIQRDGSYTNSSSFIKFGLGSSAAVTVAVCKAILALHGYDVKSYFWQEIIFKLSGIAHFIASGKTGSGFDVAAAAFESAIVYRRFDPSFLENSINSAVPLNDIVNATWPGLYIEKIYLPKNLNIIIGFCGVSSSTTAMIKKINEFKRNDFSYYNNILRQINTVVLELISALKQEQRGRVLDLIRQNRRLLQKLSLKSGANLEITELNKMIELAESCGAAAKFSGAGGGDCAIALTFDEAVAQDVRNLWKTCSIPL